MASRTHPRSVLAAAALAASSAAMAADIHVPGDQPTIQQAIVSASDGDRVLVDAGTYAEHIDFLGKNIQVLSTAGAAATVIDGTQSGTVATFQTGETHDASLSGFTIRGGSAPSRNGVAKGGGIFIEGASPLIFDNVIVGNVACDGGGVEVISGSPHIRHNHVQHNRSKAGCHGYGAGLNIETPLDALVEDNLIEGNGGPDAGGGVSLLDSGHATLAGNIIRENSAPAGSGVYSRLSNLRLVDNVIVSNSDQGLNSSFERRVKNTVLALVNNTIADNGQIEVTISAAHGRMEGFNNIIRSTRADYSILCSSVAANRANFSHNLVYSTDGAEMVDLNCNLAAGGLIDEDPRFIGTPGAHAYWLQAGSPAIDAGINSADKHVRQDATGAPRIVNGTVDLGAYEFRGE
jgi:hypothetical protein